MARARHPQRSLHARRPSEAAPAALRCSVIVCAYNEERCLDACVQSLQRQTRPADEILVVDNASTDGTAAVAANVAGVRLITEPRRGLVLARVAGQRAANGDVLVYLDADCRAPADWLARIEAILRDAPDVVAVTSDYRFYDWDVAGRLLIRLYDWIAAPMTHVCLQHVLRVGAILYGGISPCVVRRWRRSAASIRRSTSTGRTPIWAGA